MGVLHKIHSTHHYYNLHFQTNQQVYNNHYSHSSSKDSMVKDNTWTLRLRHHRFTLLSLFITLQCALILTFSQKKTTDYWAKQSISCRLFSLFSYLFRPSFALPLKKTGSRAFQQYLKSLHMPWFQFRSPFLLCTLS